MSKYIEDVCDDEYPTFKNIINKIPAPKLEYTRKKTYLPDSDFTLLKNELKNRGEWQKLSYLSLAYDSASRKSEINQTLKNIDFVNNETTVVRGKGGKKFTQPFSDETAEYIKKWLEVRGTDNCEKLFVIQSHDNTVRPISKGILNAWCVYFSDVYKEITGKDEWIYPHCFKSNRLSNLYHESKVPLEIVQQYGHHSSPDVTLKSYIEQKSSTVRDIIFKKNEVGGQP
jgi:integrase